MSKYDFIKQGNLLFWHTADNDIECRIISTPEKVDSDSIILISTSSSETEVLASELLPIGSSRSHKEEFMRWKKEREAEGMEFRVVCTLEPVDMLGFGKRSFGWAGNP